MSSHTPTSIDPHHYREALGHYASGIVIITGHDVDGPIGFTCQSFHSVSLEPPLISFGAMRTSTSYPRIRKTGRFAVNVLAEGQGDLSRQFAQSGSDKWNSIQWQPSGLGHPVLDSSLLWLECEVAQEIEAGDHFVVIGRVMSIAPGNADEPSPLLYYRGRYHHLMR